MADVYVSGTGSNTSPYETWAKAATTLTTALTGAVAGTRFIIDKTLVESSTGADKTYTFPGLSTNMDIVLSATNTGLPFVPADLAFGAKLMTTGSNVDLRINGSFYAYGLDCEGGDSSGSHCAIGGGTTAFQQYEECVLRSNSGSGASQFSVSGTRVTFRNVSLQLGNTGGVTPASVGFVGSCLFFEWENDDNHPSFASGATPPALLVEGFSGNMRFVGLDLSAVDNIFPTNAQQGGNGGVFDWKLINCKLKTGVTVAATPTAPGFFGHSTLIDSHSGASGGVGRYEAHGYGGIQRDEKTIYRSGGATNAVGENYSFAFVPNANNKRLSPFRTPWHELRNMNVGVAKTLAVHLISSASLTDLDIFLELDYLYESTSTRSDRIDSHSFASRFNWVLGPTGTALPASTETWAASPATPVKQKLSIGFTPQLAGPIRWRLIIASADAANTIYYCPQAVLT